MKKIKKGDLVYVRSSTNKILKEMGVALVISNLQKTSDSQSEEIKNIYTILWRGNIESNVDSEWISPLEIEKETNKN
tara:strand:+ start:556 stop:786 length:231 start_codon:yes stop_codon:yes gene_type:complete